MRRLARQEDVMSGLERKKCTEDRSTFVDGDGDGDGDFTPADTDQKRTLVYFDMQHAMLYSVY
jgi:hypothetical protein